jgi:hypothetical protein
MVGDRLWRGSAASVADAIAFCDRSVGGFTAVAAGQTLPSSVGRPPRHLWAYMTLMQVP